jgi:hypothetical protein
VSLLSTIVAYLEFARGHPAREQRPVRLYLFLQKFCFTVFTLNEQKP